MELKLKDEDLFKYGANYVFASFSHPQSPTMIYAIFRDLVDDGKTQFVMPQHPQGPWNMIVPDDTPEDTTDDLMMFNPAFDDVLLEVTKRVSILQQQLNDNVAGETWNGRTTLAKG